MSISVEEVQRLAEKELAFLVEDYGFQLIDRSRYGLEAHLSYRNAITGIGFIYEHLALPDCSISRLDLTGPRPASDWGLSVHALLMEHETIDYRKMTITCPSVDQIREHISEIARILKTYGPPLLRGNFSNWPKLQMNMKILTSNSRWKNY